MIADNIVGQVVERAPAVPVVQMVMHNDNDFGDPDDRVCRNFGCVLDELTAAIHHRELTATGATFADVAGRLRATDVIERDFTYAHATMLAG